MYLGLETPMSRALLPSLLVSCPVALLLLVSCHAALLLLVSTLRYLF